MYKVCIALNLYNSVSFKVKILKERTEFNYKILIYSNNVLYIKLASTSLFWTKFRFRERH